MNNSNSVDINGNKIKLFREKNELTQLYLATVVGVTTDTISRWENRRYPSIKLENAKKLAEALGVPLEELLDEPDKAADADRDEPVDEADSPAKSRSPARGLVAFAARHKKWLSVGGGLLFFAGMIIFLIIENRPGIRAVRHLPKHTAPNLPFPVIIETVGEADTEITLLIREELLGDAEATGPSAEGAPKQFGKNPRWIGKLHNGRATFLYLVQPGKKLRPQDVIRFSGDIIVREGQTVGDTIGGVESIAIAPYHRVDTNQDYVISDSEILNAYETYSIPGDNLINFTAIEELWLAGKYTWNKKTLAFTPSYLADGKE
jgi:transcriptional regulator with XRE-family HTH domain